MSIRAKIGHSGNTPKWRTPVKEPRQKLSNLARAPETSDVSRAQWFTENQIMPMLSPYWSWRLLAK